MRNDSATVASMSHGVGSRHRLKYDGRTASHLDSTDVDGPGGFARGRLGFGRWCHAVLMMGYKREFLGRKNNPGFPMGR